MCHQSVGLIQDQLERAGLATVSLTVRPEITAGMRVPRAAYVRFPTGSPLGEPGHPGQHLAIARAALGLLESATGPQTLVELPYRWKRMEG